MQVTFLGGADEVGGSCTLVRFGDRNIVIDCGIRLGSGGRGRLPDLVRLPDKIDAILVTHAHTDHTGALPILSKMKHAPIYATAPTKLITEILLQDSLRIMGHEAKRDGPPPAFNEDDVEKMFSKMRLVKMGESFRPFGDELSVCFLQSGHIPGSASISIRSPQGDLFVSGDVSDFDQHSVRAMHKNHERHDVAILESTYGSRTHKSRSDEEDRLIAEVNTTLIENGTVLFPTFAVGRAQEIITILSKAMAEKRLRSVPIYVDGMVVSVCDVYKSFPEAVNLRLTERIHQHGDPFFYPSSNAVKVPQGARLHTAQQRGVIIVASSGMLVEKTPSHTYATLLAWNPSNLIAITGYQDEESPGRSLQEFAHAGKATLSSKGRAVPIRCKVRTYGLSAHSDKEGIKKLAKKVGAPEVILVHGDDEARRALSAELRHRFNVHLPVIGARLTFGESAQARQSEEEIVYEAKYWGLFRQLFSCEEVPKMEIFDTKAVLYFANEPVRDAHLNRRIKAAEAFSGLNVVVNACESAA